MKAKTSKEFIRPSAIKHYLEKTTLYTFMSLYSDNEPFPLDEVIELQKERIIKLETSYNKHPTNFLFHLLLKDKKILTQLEARKGEMNNERNH